MRAEEGQGRRARRAVCAFVVFWTRQARDDCPCRFTGREAAEYSLRCWGQRHELRLRGHRLTVRRAAEPADVLWENLECGRARWAGRRLGS